MNVPEIIKDDEEKSIAFRAGCGDDDAATQLQGVIAAHPLLKENYAWLRESHEDTLPERERAIVNCWKWGRAFKERERVQKYGRRYSDFHESGEEKERIGSMDAYQYMMQLERNMGIPPDCRYQQ